MKTLKTLLIAFIVVFAAQLGSAQIKLNVDATEAPRNILHVTERITVTPGPLTLFYPKWIPGEHSPTGPINDLVGLKITGNSKSIPWRRDDVEMFAFHCEVPAGVNELEISLDDASQPETTASAKL